MKFDESEDEDDIEGKENDIMWCNKMSKTPERRQSLGYKSEEVRGKTGSVGSTLGALTPPRSPIRSRVLGESNNSPSVDMYVHMHGY